MLRTPSCPAPSLARSGIAVRPRRALGALLVGACIALTPTALPLLGPLGAPAAQAAPAGSWPLVVTEIAPDATGADEFEYIEVTNTSDAPIVLGGPDGHQLAYIYADSDDRTKDVPLAPAAPVGIPAGGTAVLWLQYTATGIDTAARTEEDFRAAWKMTSDAPIVRISGQPGMANGGNRGIRVSDAAGTEVSRSFYPTGSASAGTAVQFRTPADGAALSMEVLAPAAAPSPGTVDATQLEDRAPDPTDPADPVDPVEPTDPPVEPTDPPTDPAEPTDPAPTDPAEPTDPAPTEPTDPAPTDPAQPVPGPAADSLVGQLQITELVVDSANVGTADGYEYIEIHNPTTHAISLADYELRYLYPLDDLTITNAATWTLDQPDATVPAGGTVVAWVKNPGNASLTAADFAAHYGVDPAGLTVLTTQTAGMANGSPRGMEIRTRTGATVHRVFYNIGGADDVETDQGIQFAVDPADFSHGALTGIAPATPGAVTPGQAPTEPVDLRDDQAAPQVEDLTAASFDPAADALIVHRATDDVQVRRATLEVRSDLDADFASHDLLAGDDDTFTYTVPQADLTGKSWIEYRLTASDGVHETTTEVVRVGLDGVSQDPLRLNVADGQFVRGTVDLAVAGDEHPATGEVCVDGTDLAGAEPSLESSPVFVFEASQTDTYFRNGVLMDGEVLTIFDEGFYAEWRTVSTQVPLARITPGQPTTLQVAAGTKAYPGIDLNENNDDFVIRNLRLVLPDGRTLRAPSYEDAAQIIQMGDSAGKNDLVDAAFSIPEDAYTARSAPWDTTAATDGEHVVCGHDAAGNRVERTVIVDNTAPVITPGIEDGRTYQGSFTLDASADDAGSGLASLTGTLDGKPVQLPTELSSLTLPAGEHVLELSAADTVGNTTTRTVRFTTPVENPTGEPVTADGAQIDLCQDPALVARVEDPSSDPLSVSFRRGHRTSLEDGTVRGSAGTVRDADTAEREGTALTAGTATTSGDALPFHAFDVDVPADAGESAEVRVAWSGSADPGARVRLLVWNVGSSSYEEVGTALAADDGSVSLSAVVPAAGHALDGVVKAVVQHSVGWSGENLSDRATPVDPAHPEDTPRSEYDFTLAWESDTQYYNATFPERQIDIHDYLLERREELNLQYVFHTGDIVDKYDNQGQWDRADSAYRMLDEAQLPYGVLAGNHDVGHLEVDYTNYGQRFGQERFEANPWYGESYEDNRGHYDLVSAGGNDFLMLYMGWGPGDEEIAWMNEVLAKYPERTAIIDLHEYMLTTGGLGPIPQRIYDEVVAPNPNVRMVMSGHYHDAYTRTDSFDDDGDGTPERDVTQMLFDYQGLPEGGQALLRLMHFDDAGGRMIVRTYSPYLKQYDSEDPTLEPEHQEFTVGYDALGLSPHDKSLTTTSFTADVLTDQEIASFADVASGTELRADLTGQSAGELGWYVLTEDAHGGRHMSDVRTVTLVDGACAAPGPGNGNGNGQGNGKGNGNGNGQGKGHGDEKPGKGKGRGNGNGNGNGKGNGNGNGNGKGRGAVTGSASS